jgi:small-conductance mechanosensitive channel
MQDQLNSAGNYFDTFARRVVDALPAVLGALIVLLIGYVIARILETLVEKSLETLRLDSRLHQAHGGRTIQRVVPHPSRLVSQITFWVVFFFAISLAVSVLGIPALIAVVGAIYSYIPNVIAAVLIFLVASAVSAGVATLVSSVMGDTPTAKVISSAAPVVIMGLAAFMILNQLQIAKDIVVITYAALMGSAALGLALAFGLGGRDIAKQMLADLYSKSRPAVTQVKHSVREARGEASAEEADGIHEMRRKGEINLR